MVCSACSRNSKSDFPHGKSEIIFSFSPDFDFNMAVHHINNSSAGGKMSILQDRLVRKRLKSVLHVEPSTLELH